MNILKVKSIFFSLMAMMVIAVFMTSCEQTGDKVVEPITDDTAILEAILDASTGNAILNQSSGVYEFSVNPEDLSSEIIDAIRTKEELILPENLLLAQEVAAKVFCESIRDCDINDDVVINQGIFEIEHSNNSGHRGGCIGISFDLCVTGPNGTQVCTKVCIGISVQ